MCPGGLATGYTYFLPLEETLESRVVTRGYMEAKMVVAMAGRCAERLVLGEAGVSTAGASDLEAANGIARGDGVPVRVQPAAGPRGADGQRGAVPQQGQVLRGGGGGGIRQVLGGAYLQLLLHVCLRCSRKKCSLLWGFAPFVSDLTPRSLRA